MSHHAPKRSALLKTIAPSVMAATTLGVLSLGGISGCDTLAQISFSDREFGELQIIGLTPEAGSCQGSTGDAVMRFVMIDTDSAAISNETVIGGSTVAPVRGDLAINTPTYFSFPDVECASADDCPAGFACDVADDGTNRCQDSSGGASIGGDASFRSTLTSNQVFAVLVENTASISGRLPAPIANLEPDYKGGGDDGSEPDGLADGLNGVVRYKGEDTSRATDPGNIAKTAVTSMAEAWRTTATLGRTNNQTDTSFGLWTFGGSSTDLISYVPGGMSGNFWVKDPNQVNTAVQNLVDDAPDTNAVASVYESMLAVMQDDDKLGSIDGADKFLVVLVDGPDDLRLDSLSAQNVIDVATQERVRIFIVHFERGVETALPSGVPLLPDLPDYVNAQSECASNDDCKNFEECRAVTGYANRDGSMVQVPAGKTTGTYCALRRDENGRIGPVDEYAQIACETGGGYMYFPDVESLGDKISFLPYAMDGLWEVPITLDAYNRGELTTGEPYNIQTEFQVTIDGLQRSKNLSQDGLYYDDRRVLFAGE